MCHHESTRIPAISRTEEERACDGISLLTLKNTGFYEHGFREAIAYDNAGCINQG